MGHIGFGMYGFWITIIILIIVLLFVKRFFFTLSSSNENALEQLKKRLVNNEISIKEYEKLKKTL